jgi:acetyl esterase/lipase
MLDHTRRRLYIAAAFILLALNLVLVFIVSSSFRPVVVGASSPQLHISPTPTYEPANWTVQGEPPSSVIQYCTLPSGATYDTDVYTPQPAPTTPMPLLIFLHGNGNETRANALKLGLTPASPLEFMLRTLMNNGYAVAVLDYPYTKPLDAEAGKCAVRFFRANATTYNIDPTRIIAWGSSYGGRAATIMGTADLSAHLDVGTNLGYSSRVETVLDWYGYQDPNSQSYITPDDAPFMIQHGLDDVSVPACVSQTLNSELTAQNIVTQIQFVANAGHIFAPYHGPTDPVYEVIAQTAVTFLNTEVKNNPNPLPQ